MFSSTPHWLKLVGADLEQCSNGSPSTFFKLCRDCQSLHAMSQCLACSSCGWGGNHLLTPRKSFILLMWLQHCLGGFHIMFPPFGSCPVEWGVGSGLWSLSNASNSYTLIGTTICYLYCQSLWLGAKACYSLCYLLSQSLLCSPPEHQMPKSVMLLHIGHQSLFCVDAKICNTGWQSLLSPSFPPPQCLWIYSFTDRSHIGHQRLSPVVTIPQYQSQMSLT